MKEKQKEENKFKQIWGNKRQRAMIQLAGYLLFFILIGVLIDFDSPHESYLESEEKTKETISFAKYDNYEFYYNITYLGLADEPVKYMNIDGYRYSNKRFFSVRDTLEKYYMDDSAFYQVTSDFVEISSPFAFLFDRLSPNLLDTYIQKAKMNSKTEYADQVIKKEYILSIQDFALLYAGDRVNVEGNIVIATYEKDKMIYKIELNLANYNKMKYELNYKNIGKVSPFSKEDVLSTFSEAN